MEKIQGLGLCLNGNDGKRVKASSAVWGLGDGGVQGGERGPPAQKSGGQGRSQGPIRKGGGNENLCPT